MREWKGAAAMSGAPPDRIRGPIVAARIRLYIGMGGSGKFSRKEDLSNWTDALPSGKASILYADHDR